MAEYKIRKRAAVCGVSGRAFVHGDTIVSAIYPDHEAGGFERRDMLDECFAQAEAPFSFWKTIHEEPPAEDRKLDYDLALTFLDKLVREADPEREGLAYTLTLLLSRKRRVKIVETRRLPDGELLSVRVPRAEEDEIVQVRAPVLGEDAVERIQSQLAELFDFEPTPAAEDGETS
jgi:hypothetical protein